MGAVLEHEEFSRHLNTRFRVHVNDSETTEAELIEISEHLVSARQERFAITFRTSNETFLGQGMRRLDHDQMGSLDLFLVPTGRNEEGTYYEAVFNRLIKNPK